MPTTTLQVETSTGVDPISSPNTASDFESKRLRIRRFIRHLFGILNGSPKSAVVRMGTAQAAAVVTCAGVLANDTVTLNGVALTAKSLNAVGTLTIDSGENLTADDAFTVGPDPGVQFIAKASPASNTEFLIGADATETAANIAAVVSAHPSMAGLLTASAATRVVTFRAAASGTGGNAYVLTEDVDSGSGGAFAVSGAGTLAGGAAAAANEFDRAGTNAQTAAALATAANDSASALIDKHLTGASSAAEVTFTARTKGHAGNAITIATSNGTRLAITGSVSRLAGGTDLEVTL